MKKGFNIDEAIIITKFYYIVLWPLLLLELIILDSSESNNKYINNLIESNKEFCSDCFLLKSMRELFIL